MLKGASFITLLFGCVLIGSQCILSFGEKIIPVFLIKHSLSGRFVHPRSGMGNFNDNTDAAITTGITTNSYFRFDQKEDHWGYIVHINSGKCFHPNGGSMHPRNGQDIVLHSHRHPGAYFAADQTRNMIVHKGGKYVHIHAGNVHTPPANNPLVIYSSIHDGMKFEFVSPFNTSEEVLVYGEPKIIGKWKIINMVLNPRAEHTDTLEYKIGKSKTLSTSFSFQYRWEISGGVDISIFSASTTFEISSMLSRSSSQTWFSESTRTRQIHVKPSESVVTWQFVWEITQDSHKGVYRTQMLADTESEKIMPRELGGERL